MVDCYTPPLTERDIALFEAIIPDSYSDEEKKSLVLGHVESHREMRLKVPIVSGLDRSGWVCPVCQYENYSEWMRQSQNRLHAFDRRLSVARLCGNVTDVLRIGRVTTWYAKRFNRVADDTWDAAKRMQDFLHPDVQNISGSNGHPDRIRES